MEISVIIPTYNRAQILDECLSKLSEQTFAQTKFEVVVVDDGSTDNTEDVVQKRQSTLTNLTYLKQNNQGQGIARNLGIKQAKGKITILIGDDMYPASNFLEQHYQFHKTHPAQNQAAIGHVDWHPNVKRTPFTKWLSNEHKYLKFLKGPQFDFRSLKNRQPNYHYFYTANISVKTELLKNNPFDTEISGYGWEDIELGYRLAKTANLQLSYLPTAKVFHNHQISVASLEQRMYHLGYNGYLVQQKHLEIKTTPNRLKSFLIQSFTNQIFLKLYKFINKLSPTLSPLSYYALSKHYMMKGKLAAQKKYAKMESN